MQENVSYSDLGRQQRKGFSLIELMITVVVLAFGIVMIYEGYLISLRGFDYSKNFLNAQMWIDEKMWDVKDKVSQGNLLTLSDVAGVFSSHNRRFTWRLSHRILAQTNTTKLFEVGLRVFWKEGANTADTRRATYLFYAQK